ncbi:MarR family transcriptional regulator [Rhodococcus oxybenzonivorans]|jgi:DNA-binding MarR family transcriptional regulator|uniref:MarR family transcriptional regulator n=2 Tax=Nocardiaceae TaxID=85025 RepID=A0AAE4V188_9NOCA|nr:MULTISPECIES: MarR family transcriptional regulator [Rhodococcus]MDV7241343.1 MarR family transcriptional regulator [Rhodococcus oxybenzonivorans]MDV7266833.1 MarR family transcriptional regulator [Rhodococcus oxybenzonivorans]MDV7274124.1 MarR family transcriptional regulator [Rhodococcus oxybenzonivorans]MDV7333623.1 MarR family transcriptional regulator [Rhodococcus oxybenzonivorans]MDV7343043.1 MarR family transcriptional regulator [Rhodococcus oxybenzonivorans]
MGSNADLRDTWRLLASRYNDIACELDREMQHAHSLSMSDFETLDRLMDATCDRPRMQDLAAEMYLSASALSRSVARLEKAGLVARSLCEADRRGVFVDVTEHGRQVHADAKKIQLAVLNEKLSDAT